MKHLLAQLWETLTNTSEQTLPTFLFDTDFPPLPLLSTSFLYSSSHQIIIWKIICFVLLKGNLKQSGKSCIGEKDQKALKN